MHINGINTVVLPSFVSTHKNIGTPFLVMKRAYSSAKQRDQPVLPDGNSHKPRVAPSGRVAHLC